MLVHWLYLAGCLCFLAATVLAMWRDWGKTP